MDEIATKAITIGVSIFVTLVITTVVILEFTQIQNVYKQVGQTNISFEENIDPMNKYRDSNNVFLGLDVKNTYKKYKDDETINVCVDTFCDDRLDINTIENSDEYYSTLDETSNISKIIFVKK